MMRIGETIAGRYRVVDLISTGGQATVARAVDQNTGRDVAIRMFSTPREAAHHDQEKSRFLRAAQLCLGHPSIVDPIDFVEEGGCLYMIMPFVDGMTLHDFVARNSGMVPLTTAIDIIRQVAGALGACHAKGITHRDIKPDNILIDDQYRAYVLDFGICSVSGEPTLTQGDKFQGSVLWTSPEQIHSPGSSDPRLDLYSLGAVFYLLLTGVLPAAGDTHEQIISSVCNDTPPSPRMLNPQIPEHIDCACMKLLQKDPARRFQTTGEFLRAVDGGAIPTTGRRCCGSCGESAMSESTFCIRCGSDLQDDQDTAARCIACGVTADNCDVCPNCSRDFSPADHRVVFEGGSLTGVAFRIPEGSYVIGRDTLAPRDFQISRRHAHLACLNGSVEVCDAGSANGTRVAGNLANQPIQLQPGVELAIAGNVGIYTTLSERKSK